MSQSTLTMEVRRPHDKASIIDISGDVTAASEDELMEAYNKASTNKIQAIILNFEGLEYMNSGGIGLLVTLLVRANRQHQKILAYGLSDHYRQIFELTRLDDAISIHDGESEALSAAGA
ncbi:MAG: STAS domain-containing protein [Actinomycetota bacterium]|nr:STAS domain-containing protein [Actinomycetota bacterium]